MAEEDLQLVLDEAKDAMDKSLASLRHELSRLRTGRANPLLLESVMVDYYGTPTQLKKLATIHVPEARLLTLQPFDPGACAAIERGILKADIGVTPISDGKTIRVPIPELTEQRRREIVKQIKKIAEDHKVSVRTARRDAIQMVKDLQKDGDVSEDDSKRIQKKIQDLTDEHVAEVDRITAAKEEEILRV
jgi:ribosome recycling factor